MRRILVDAARARTTRWSLQFQTRIEAVEQRGRERRASLSGSANAFFRMLAALRVVSPGFSARSPQVDVIGFLPHT